MSQPRYLFVPAEALAAPSPERRVNWRAVQGPSVATGVAWRLLGGNNHELGRSIPSYASIEEAAQAAKFLAEHVADAELLVAPNPATSRWGWRLTIDGVSQAASGRWYQREREARYNAMQFLEAAPSAQVATSLGSRSRLRSVAPVKSERREPARHEPAAEFGWPTTTAGATP